MRLEVGSNLIMKCNIRTVSGAKLHNFTEGRVYGIQAVHLGIHTLIADDGNPRNFTEEELKHWFS